MHACFAGRKPKQSGCGHTENLRKYENKSPPSSKLAFKPQDHPPVSKLFICPKSRRNGTDIALMVSSFYLGNCLFLLHECLSPCACSLARFAKALLELLAPYSVLSCIYDCFMKMGKRKLRGFAAKGKPECLRVGCVSVASFLLQLN